MTLSELIFDTLQRIQVRIAANIDNKGLRASGRTAASMRIEVGESEGRLVGRQYFQSLELGRPAGRVPSNFNDIIRQWIIDKGLVVREIPYKRQPSARWQPKYSVEERSLRIAAGAIAHSIATRGTLLYREGGRKDIYSPVIEEETQKLKTKISNLFVDSLKQAIN